MPDPLLTAAEIEGLPVMPGDRTAIARIVEDLRRQLAAAQAETARWAGLNKSRVKWVEEAHAERDAAIAQRATAVECAARFQAAMDAANARAEAAESRLTNTLGELEQATDERDAAVKALASERERCAEVADDLWEPDIGNAIRALSPPDTGEQT